MPTIRINILFEYIYIYIDIMWHLIVCRRHLKAVELQQYWKTLCEAEKKSQWRNEQLLKDFDRLEANMAAMSAKTERLRHQKVSRNLLFNN